MSQFNLICPGSSSEVMFKTDEGCPVIIFSDSTKGLYSLLHPVITDTPNSAAIQKRIYFFTCIRLFFYLNLLPTFVLIEVSVNSTLAIGDGEEVHFVFPIPLFNHTVVAICTVGVSRDLHSSNRAQYLSFFPPPDIPKAMPLEGQFHHSFILIFFQESVIGHPGRERRHSYSCSVSYNIHGIHCRESKSGIGRVG